MPMKMPTIFTGRLSRSSWRRSLRTQAGSTGAGSSEISPGEGRLGGGPGSGYSIAYCQPR